MTFNELDQEQQARALDNHRHINVEHTDWEDDLRYDFINKMKEYGFDDIQLLVDTSCTQGSGASFDTKNVDIEKYLRKQKRWTKFRPLHEMIRINEIECTIERASYPHYVHSNMVSSVIEIWNLDLNIRQEELVRDLESDIIDFVRSESNEIHRNLEALMLDLISDELVKETIIANDLEFEVKNNSVTYV